MASFLKYLPLLKQVEGGYQNNPDDPGNYNSLGQLVGTNFGISARFYEGIIGYPPTKEDMLSITETNAKNIFRDYFWNAQNANKINSQAVANTIIDHQINAGNGVILAQQTLNRYFGKNLAEDNQIGPLTLAALNSVSAKLFVEIYNERREDYYRNIGNQTFLAGWLKRLEKFAYDHSAAISVGIMFTTILTGFVSYQLLKN